MIKVNKKVEYALIALSYMSSKKDGELTSAREICDHHHTPFDTTAKIMQILGSAGILKSIQGVKGGYTLSKDLSEVSYIELSELVEKKKFYFGCEGPNGKVCELIDNCNIKTPINVLNHKLRDFFEELTIKELLLLDK